MTPECSLVHDDLADLVAGDSGAISRHADHLATCDDCRDARHEATQLADSLGNAGADYVMPADLVERVLAAAGSGPIAQPAPIEAKVDAPVLPAAPVAQRVDAPIRSPPARRSRSGRSSSHSARSPLSRSAVSASTPRHAEEARAPTRSPMVRSSRPARSPRSRRSIAPRKVAAPVSRSRLATTGARCASTTCSTATRPFAPTSARAPRSRWPMAHATCSTTRRRCRSAMVERRSSRAVASSPT